MIYIHNINDAKFVLDDNFKFILIFGDVNSNKFSLSFKCVSNMIAAIYSAIGFYFGLKIANKNNNLLFFFLCSVLIFVEIVHFFSKFL